MASRRLREQIMDAIGWSKPQVVELLSLCSLCFSDYSALWTVWIPPCLFEQLQIGALQLEDLCRHSSVRSPQITAEIEKWIRKLQSNWSRIKDELALSGIAFARTPYRANWNPRTLRKSLNASNRREMRRAWEELRRTEENYRSRMAPPARVPVTKALSRLIPALQRL